MPPVDTLHIIRKGFKANACFAKSTVVIDFGLAPTAGIAVVITPRCSAVGDKGFECREAAYYNS
jgi:hypothetical protein